MFIKEVQVSNFRLFPAAETPFNVSLNVPDGESKGSGLTAFVGENGCGKTTLLDAVALALLPFKADTFALEDFNDPTKEVRTEAHSNAAFSVRGTMPNSEFDARGFAFVAHIRDREKKNYLSSIVVSDQLFIRDGGLPRDGSPDLRVQVNNPFSGKRFDENDVLLLDKNRTHHTRLGSFSPTQFDRLMEDFDLQYVVGHKGKPIEQISQTVKRLADPPQSGMFDEPVPNSFLSQAIEKFKEISNVALDLDLVDDWRPYKHALFTLNKQNGQQIPLAMLGSGYEMIFSILLRFHLAKQSAKQLICLIDEPELHLHPALQERLVEMLLEFSENAQIVLSTHSPLLVKQLAANKRVRIQVLKRESGVPVLADMERGVLPYVSANEINYRAFGLATVEYHDELYGHLQEKSGKFTEKEVVAFLNGQGVESDKEWIREGNGSSRDEKPVPLSVFIRNKIHHPENHAMQEAEFTPEELKQSTQTMIGIAKKLRCGSRYT